MYPLVCRRDFFSQLWKLCNSSRNQLREIEFSLCVCVLLVLLCDLLFLKACIPPPTFWLISFIKISLWKGMSCANPWEINPKKRSHCVWPPNVTEKALRFSNEHVTHIKLIAFCIKVTRFPWEMHEGSEIPTVQNVGLSWWPEVRANRFQNRPKNRPQIYQNRLKMLWK